MMLINIVTAQPIMRRPRAQQHQTEKEVDEYWGLRIEERIENWELRMKNKEWWKMKWWNDDMMNWRNMMNTWWNDETWWHDEWWLNGDDDGYDGDDDDVDIDDDDGAWWCGGGWWWWWWWWWVMRRRIDDDAEAHWRRLRTEKRSGEQDERRLIGLGLEGQQMFLVSGESRPRPASSIETLKRLTVECIRAVHCVYVCILTLSMLDTVLFIIHVSCLGQSRNDGGAGSRDRDHGLVLKSLDIDLKISDRDQVLEIIGEWWWWIMILPWPWWSSSKADSSRSSSSRSSSSSSSSSGSGSGSEGSSSSRMTTHYMPYCLWAGECKRGAERWWVGE